MSNRRDLASEEATADKSLQQDSLAHLEQVLAQSRSLLAVRQSTDALGDATRDVEARVAALRLEQSELQRQLGAAAHASVRDVLGKGNNNKGDVDENSAVQASRAQLLQRVAEQSERRNVDELHTAYRLAGKTAVQLKDQTGLAIRIDTSFDGRFYESYYVLLGGQQGDDGHFTLEKHTVPYFVPMRALAEQLLNSDLDRFLDATSDFCNAVVSRRQQCELLKQLAGVTNMAVTDAFDFVQLTVAASSRHQLTVLAAFDNLRSGKPTRLEVVAALDQQRQYPEIAARLVEFDRLDLAIIEEFQLH